MQFAKGEYVPPGLNSEQRNKYREAVHRYKDSYGLPGKYDVPKWILDEIADALKRGKNVLDAAGDASSPPGDDWDE